MPQTKTALVFGGTGLTGRHLLDQLNRDPRYDEVVMFSRKEFPHSYPKLRVSVVDVLKPQSYQDKIKGEDLFCCIGTTRKKAGSKEAFEQVDFNFPANLAEIAEENGVPNFIIISSIGASPKSWSHYLRTKGLMEEAVRKHAFHKLYILRPSLILGRREEFRWGEEIAKFLNRAFKYLFKGRLKKYKAVYAGDIAKCMTRLANSMYNQIIIESKDIKSFCK